jgi:hypothetical protein
MKSRAFTVVFFLLTLALFLISLPLWAQDDCRGNRNCNDGIPGNVNTDVVIDNPVSVDSNVSHSSRAYGFGLGDVDIAQCYRSWSALVVQFSQANLWCMANDLDARGLHDAAARTRCSVKAYRKNFPSRQDCIAGSTVVGLVVLEDIEPDRIDEDEEIHVEQMIAIDQLKEQVEQLQIAAQRPRRAVVQQKPLLKE